MASSSLTNYHLNQLFFKADPKYTLSSAFFAFVAMKCWMKTLGIVATIHEETEETLDEDLRDALIDGVLDD